MLLKGTKWQRGKGTERQRGKGEKEQRHKVAKCNCAGNAFSFNNCISIELLLKVLFGED